MLRRFSTISVVVLFALGFVLFLTVMAQQDGGAPAAAAPADPFREPQPDAAAMRETATAASGLAVSGQTNSLVLPAVADTFVDETSPTRNFGGDTSMIVRQRSGGTDRAAILVKFDLASVPADAVLVSATLSLRTPRFAGPAAPAFTMTPYHLSSWSEFGRGGAVWNNKPAFTPLGDPPAPYGGSNTRFDVFEIVSGWIDGTLVNNGIGIAPDLGVVGEVTFGTRESSYRPALTLHYTLRTVLPASQDTYVDIANPGSNYASAGYLRVWRNNSPYRLTRALVDFDWSALPPHIAVIRATLQTYSELNLAQQQPNALSGGELYADAIMADWTDTTVTWNNQPRTDWRGDTAADLTLNGWTSWDVTNIVSAWADGTLAPEGIQLHFHTGATGVVDYFDLPSASAPRLIVEYITVPAPCNALTAASISGPTAGTTGVPYDFSANLSPATADPPFNYLWTATDLAGNQTSAIANFTWNSPGTKTVSLSVQNCGGTVNASRQVIIQDPPPTCSSGIAALSLDGPLTGKAGSSYQFDVLAAPVTATTPITYHWQATGVSDEVRVGASTSDSNLYQWPTPGSRAITVTASNCGGTLVASRSFEVQDGTQLPDLFVSGNWYDPDRDGFFYLLRNQGPGVATGGHSTQLQQSGIPLIDSLVTDTLPAGAIRAYFLDHAWSCPNNVRLATFAADQGQLIAEKDEGNNEAGRWVKCDLRPPQFVNGPTVVTTTEQTAVISWETDEPAEYEIAYSRFAYMNALTVQSSNQLTQHQVTLANLDAGHTYQFQVMVTDDGNNRNNSRQLTFVTQPPGSDPPDVTNLDFHLYDSPFYEYYRVLADVADAGYVDRIEFYLDGQHVGTDYSPATATALNVPRYDAHFSPHALGYTRQSFFTDLLLEAHAYGLNGRSTIFSRTITPVDPGQPYKLRIINPRDGDTFYMAGAQGTNGDKFWLNFDAAKVVWGCTWSGYSDGYVVPPGLSAVQCDDVASRVSAVRATLDGQQIGEINGMPFGAYTGMSLRATVNTFYPGQYDLVLEAYDGAAVAKSVTHTLNLAVGAPNVMVTRTISRIENRFEVKLTLKNEGTLPSQVYRLEDNVTSFQQLNVPPALGALYDVSTAQAYFSGAEMIRRNHVAINLHEGGADYVELDPGEAIDVSYVVVPVMYDTATYQSAAIGELPVKVYLQELGNDLVQRHALPDVKVYDAAWGADMSLALAIQKATGAADYIIVTSPRRLFSNYVDQAPITGTARADIEHLFSRMAELAALKQGVLGYLHSDDRIVLDNLIEPSGWWARQMNPVFNQRDGGYVLLVGETEIIPSHYIGTDHFITGPDIPDLCRKCDLPYANTQGNTARPELVVGRLIGDSLWALNRQLDVTLGVANGLANYSNDRSHAVLISGKGEYSNKFRSAINTTEYHFFTDFTLTKMHWSQMADQAERTEALTMTTPGADLLVFDGHGNHHGWSNGLDSTLAHNGKVPLGGSNPMAVAVACTTGNYEKENDYNLSEILMARGFGNYFGATGISEIWTNGRALVKFAYEWDPGEPIGHALNAAKRYIWGYETIFTHGELWAYQYNLYGDPKFGVLATLPMASRLATAQDSYDIQLPDLVHQQIDGFDEFDIPGQPVMSDLGYYPVPFWTLEVDYPPGQRLQSVSLSNLGLPEPMTGITMVLNQAAVACDHCDGGILATLAPASPVITGWTPGFDTPVRWRVEDNADGSSRVEIAVNPFQFNPTTGDAVYFREFTLEMDVITTGVMLEELSVQPQTLRTGDILTANLRLSNYDSPQDVVVQASVRLRGNNAFVTGLPLQTLHQLSGQASTQLAWDSNGLAQGDYQLMVELLDGEGNQLASQVDEFGVGILDGQVTGLSASASEVKPGEPISFTLAFANAGTVPYTGTATIQVQPVGNISDSVTFHVASPLLTASETWTTTIVWDASVSAAQFRVIGLVRYRSQSTEPSELWLTGGYQLYLPAIVRP